MVGYERAVVIAMSLSDDLMDLKHEYYYLPIGWKDQNLKETIRPLLDQSF